MLHTLLQQNPGKTGEGPILFGKAGPFSFFLFFFFFKNDFLSRKRLGSISQKENDFHSQDALTAHPCSPARIAGPAQLIMDAHRAHACNRFQQDTCMYCGRICPRVGREAMKLLWSSSHVMMSVCVLQQFVSEIGHCR